MKPRLILSLIWHDSKWRSLALEQREDVQMMRRGRAERSQAAAGMITQEDFSPDVTGRCLVSANRAFGIQLKQPAAKRARTKKKQADNVRNLSFQKR